jgi:apolipoprotein N-acyltransferase
LTASPGAFSAVWLALRSLLWAIFLAGFFARYLPWRVFGVARVPVDMYRAAHVVGVLCIGSVAALLAACIVEFARSGKGTLSPVDPPPHLVSRGL